MLGLGNIGPLAGKPVMEGKACLFKKFAGIDVFDIEVAEPDPDKLVEVIVALEPTFGGINLEDIKAPECFIVEKKCRERMKIPVFHDDQHGTAIIVAAAILNALKLVGKDIGEVKLAGSGAGAAALACLNLLVSLGLKRENIFISDIKGVVYEGRTELMDEYKAIYAQPTSARTLAEILVGADIFLGLSAGGVLKPEMVKAMAPKPIILALANPEPEIRPELAKQVRPEAIICTGRSDYPNQVNNVLCFPFIFRGALDVGATTINEEMKLAAVNAIAELARAESSEIVANAYGAEDSELRPRLSDPATVRSAPHRAHRAGRRQGRGGQRRRDPADCRPRSLPRAAWPLRLPFRHQHEAGVRRRQARRPSASSTPRARTSACCAPRRSSSTKASPIPCCRPPDVIADAHRDARSAAQARHRHRGRQHRQRSPRYQDVEREYYQLVRARASPCRWRSEEMRSRARP